MKKTRLVLGMTVWFVLTGLCAGILFQGYAAENQQKNVTIDARITLSALISLTENHIKKVDDSLAILSQMDAARSGNWNKIKPLLAEIQASCVPGVFWFALPDGSYYITDKGLTGQTIKDREYFPGLMAGRKIPYTLIVSKSTGRKSLVCASPITKDGKVIGALGASLFLEQLQETLKKEAQMPDDMIFYALDNHGTTVLSWKNERTFLKPSLQGSKTMAMAAKEMLRNESGTVEYEFQGQACRVIYQTSPLTGWHFALGHTLKK